MILLNLVKKVITKWRNLSGDAGVVMWREYVYGLRYTTILSSN